MTVKTEAIKFDLDTPGAKRKVIIFFIKLAVIFTLWFGIYGQVLAPRRTIDKPLTYFISVSVLHCVNLMSGDVPFTLGTNLPERYYNLIRNNISILRIYDSCNCINIMFTYIAVIIALPNPLKRKLLFILSGLAAIIVADILRIIILLYVYLHFKSAFHFSHDYLFTILIDLLVLYFWMLFTRKKSVL